MHKAVRVSFLQGQSYSPAEFINYDEMVQLGIPTIFNVNTVCFRADGKWRFSHINNLNVIQLKYTPSRVFNSVNFTKIVTSDDSIYGPGSLITKSNYIEAGIPDIFQQSNWATPLVFTTPNGTYMVPDVNVTLLELDEIKPHGQTPRCGSSSPLHKLLD